MLWLPDADGEGVLHVLSSNARRAVAALALGWVSAGAAAAGPEPAPVGEAHVAPPAAPLSGEQCTVIAAEIAARKAAMRAIGSQAVASSNAQVATEGALAGTAVAGAMIAQVVGLPGHIVTEIALEAQKAKAKSALNAADQRMASAVAISREIAVLTRHYKAGCPQEEKK